MLQQQTSLSSRYAEALRDFDSRAAQYVPRRMTTAIGTACLLYISDGAERQARLLRDESRKAEAALRERQRQHPLYHTHHQERLLAIWSASGEPGIPPLALDHFTNWIMRHSDSDEDTVRRHAEALESASIDTVLDRLGSFGAKFFRTDTPTPRTERNLRRTLRSAYRQFNEQAAHILGIVGKHKQKYVSDNTRNNRIFQLQQQQKWIDATALLEHGQEPPRNAADFKNFLQLKNCIRTAEHRFAELYTLVKGQEQFFTNKGFVPLFITLTAPAEFHPNPSAGSNKWDGSTPRDSHDWFNANWQNTRATLAKQSIKLDGFRVTEPHKDGCEHWHLMCYVKHCEIDNVKATINQYFAHSQHAVTFKADFSKDAKNKKATAASYMLKYLIKTMGAKASAGTSAVNDTSLAAEADAADAWRATWGIRAFQFFGTLFGKQTLWRELRRVETQPQEPAARKLWRAARGGRAHDFIATIANDAPAMGTLREIKQEWSEPDENGEIEVVGEKPGRVVGVQINRVRYITHTTRYELKTDFKALNEDPDFEDFVPVTVIHKSPRAYTNSPEHGQNWPPGHLTERQNDVA